MLKGEFTADGECCTMELRLERQHRISTKSGYLSCGPRAIEWHMPCCSSAQGLSSG